MSRRSLASRDSGRGSSMGSTMNGSPYHQSTRERKSYRLESSLTSSSHLSYVLPDSSQLSAPSFSGSSLSLSSTSSSSSSTRSDRTSKQSSNHSRSGTSSSSDDVSQMRRTLGTCRLSSPNLSKYSLSSSRLETKTSDVSRFRAGVIDTSYIDSFDVDYERENRHRSHSQSMFSINSSFHPQLNSTEVSIRPSHSKGAGRRVLQPRNSQGSVAGEVDILICGVCRVSFSSLSLFQKHKERRNCQRCKCNGHQE